MAPSPCPDPAVDLTRQERILLLDLAADSIEYGLHRNEPFPVKVEVFPTSLTVVQTCFVTLTKQGELRGCIGSVEATRPLVRDVSEHAFQAAFRDPRFEPVGWSELELLDISISILSPNEPLRFASEEDLLRQLRPRIDGLILEEGGRHVTFLPAVWESLPDPREFLATLKAKAGWPRSYWSDRITAYRYTTTRIP